MNTSKNKSVLLLTPWKKIKFLNVLMVKRPKETKIGTFNLSLNKEFLFVIIDNSEDNNIEIIPINGAEINEKTPNLNNISPLSSKLYFFLINKSFLVLVV